jgi:hypothetical protein
LLNAAEYPSGLRGRIANPLFVGSNPTSAYRGAGAIERENLPRSTAQLFYFLRGRGPDRGVNYHDMNIGSAITIARKAGRLVRKTR